MFCFPVMRQQYSHYWQQGGVKLYNEIMNFIFR